MNVKKAPLLDHVGSTPHGCLLLGITTIHSDEHNSFNLGIFLDTEGLAASCAW